MKPKNQKITYFNSKIFFPFLVVFVFSCFFLAFQKANKEVKNFDDLKIETSGFYKKEKVLFWIDSDDVFSCEWDFGDGSPKSFELKTKHEFVEVGEYVVKLLLNGEWTLEKKVKISERIKEKEKKEIKVGFKAPYRVFQGETVVFYDESLNAESWEWQFGETAIIDSRERNPKYRFKSLGVKTVSLKINGDENTVEYRDVIVVAKASKEIVRNKKRDDFLLKEDSLVQIFPEKHSSKPMPGYVKSVSKKEFIDLIYLISENKITLSKFKNHFCYDYPPLIKVNKEKEFISLEQFYKSIKNKKIVVNNVEIKKVDGKCVESFYVKFYKRPL